MPTSVGFSFRMLQPFCWYLVLYHSFLGSKYSFKPVTASVLSLSFPMTAINPNCSGCGLKEELLQCAVCAERMDKKGMSQALCKKCVIDPDTISMFGTKPSGDVLGFSCNACVKFLERREQEKLFQTLKPPSPETILRTIAGKFPWALTIARADSDELYEALQTLKRKLSGHRTVAALADSLANTNSHAAVLLQNLSQTGAGADSSITSKALRTFVKNQCPSVKYKTLLLPPNGSIHKATRHFQDMLRVEDPLVVALAKERIFFCEWAESNYRPVASAKQRGKGDVPEVPEFALAILRSIFKSLSNSIKNNANKMRTTT